LVKIRLLAALLALSITVGCKAQSSANTALDSATLARRVEVLVRAQYNLPAEFDVTVGVRKPSNISGYETLPVTIAHGAKSQVVDFLISADGQKFGRLETVDLANNAMFHIDTANRPMRGNVAAKVTVINFDDLECPYCARMHQTLFPATLKHYGDKVRFVYKDFPLLEIHPWAMRAAVDADCLGAQSTDAYWAFVDYVHSHGDEVNGQDHDLAKSQAALDRITRQQATIANLDTAKLGACLTAQDETRVRASLKEGLALGIDGAPAVFVNGERINGGAQPQEEVWKVIDRALRAEGIEPPAEPAAKTSPAKSN
jgi:protein-disulfide isomerase